MEKISLGDVVSFSKGQQINGDELMKNGRYDYLNGGINPSGCWNDFNVTGDTVTISEGGNSCGYVNYMSYPFWCGAHCYYLYDSKLNNKYLYYALKSQQERIMKLRTGACMPNIKKTDLGKFELYITTDISAQELTVFILDKIANLIDKRKKQLEKLDELVKSRFIEMFGDINTNPMGWKQEQLQSNATLLNGRAYKQDELLDSGKYPVLRVGNFFSNRSWYYSDLELDDNKYCDDGDLLYAWSASFGPRIWGGGKAIYHYHIWKVLVGENYNKQFLCSLLDYVTASLMGDTHGIGMMHLTKSGMEETEFIVPPLELQNQFAAFVKQVGKSKFEIKQSLKMLELLKKALMQKYFG